MSAVTEDRIADLLELVGTDPMGALRSAESELDDVDPADLRTASKLRWVIGLAERELGNLDVADGLLQGAGSLAIEAGADDIAANIESSRALIVARQGRLDEALTMLRSAEPRTAGPDHARLMGQLGTVLYWRGDFLEAAATLTACCEELAGFGDLLGEARYRANLGGVWGQAGRYDDARTSLTRAITLAESAGHDVVVGTARQNLGFLAVLEGDLPGALSEFVASEVHFERAGAHTNLPRLFADHAQALADAALFRDAESYLDRAIALFRAQGQETELAGGLLTAAEIHLANGDIERSIGAAQDAASWFRKQGRDGWVAAATHLVLLAAARGGDVSIELARSLDDVADALARTGLTVEATRTQLYAAKVRGDISATDGVDPVPPDVRRAARRGRSADQILLAHIDALVAGERHDSAAARRAISQGLRVAMSNQAALGSIETRAHAAVHGYALTELGARLAIADGRPRELLLRIEATRLMSSRLPEVRPPEDPEMAGMLTELRSLNATIADPSSTDEHRGDAERARVRAERDIRRRSRTARGDSSNVRVREELGSALALLGDRHLLAHAALDGRLHAVSVINRRARLHDLGSLDGVREMLDEIAFSLNRLNRVQGSEASRLAAAEMLFEVAAELSELLLPPDVADALDPVVIVPTAVLHDVPWGLLPPLGGRAVSVNPSVSAWARAERTRQERMSSRHGPRSVGFMAGPGLEYADFEVANLAALYTDPDVSTGDRATVAACVELLGRADLVHIACHGQFRTDNPMFSSLQLADGQLIVHDLERLERLPETVILPACSVATAKALQGGSLLGLATALTTLGACNVIAPLTPINDASSVTVMDRLHHELIAGSSPAAALAVAALEHDLTDPTAGAFITLGA